MPYDAERLHHDIAQVQHPAAGFGSGRLIAKNLVLTAAHTLFSAENGDVVTEDWQVRFGGDRRPDRPWSFRECNKVVWYCRDLDIALIEVTAAADDPAIPQMVMRVADVTGNNRHSVVAQGYPLGSIQTAAREMTPIHGKLKTADTDKPLILGVEDTERPDDPVRDWPGMSGSAVLYEEWHDASVIWIYGVVQAVPANFGGQLRIARLGEAWRRPAFRALLVAAGVPDRDPGDPTSLERQILSSDTHKALAAQWLEEGYLSRREYDYLLTVIGTYHSDKDGPPELYSIITMLNMTPPWRDRIAGILRSLLTVPSEGREPVVRRQSEAPSGSMDILAFLDKTGARRVRDPRGLADWSPAGDRDATQHIVAEDGRRGPYLEIRLQRMAVSPMAYFRGSVEVMTGDLCGTPHSGLAVQSCGDCQLMTFAAFPLVDGHPILDNNNFSETFELPFEWDVKRLATSAVLAGKILGLDKSSYKRLGYSTARAYRKHMKILADLSPLEAVHSHVELSPEFSRVYSKHLRKNRLAFVGKDGPKIDHRIIDKIKGIPPKLKQRPMLQFHPNDADLDKTILDLFNRYLDGTNCLGQKLIGHFKFVDAAITFAGVANVDRLNAVGLFVTDNDHMILLQLREAYPSAVEALAARQGVRLSAFPSAGDRVVFGANTMQAVNDPFLSSIEDGHYYIKSPRHASNPFDLMMQNEGQVSLSTSLCAKALACAHARSYSNLANIVRFLGADDAFDKVIGLFALEYTKTVEADYAKFVNSEKVRTLSGTLSGGMTTERA